MKWLRGIGGRGERPRDEQTSQRLVAAVTTLEGLIDKLSNLTDDHKEGRLGEHNERR